MRSRLALLACLALLGAARADLCASYDAEQCEEHAEQCTSCHAFDKIFMCLETRVARQLPAVFHCDLPPPPPAAANTDCSGLEETACARTQHCVWCVSAAVPSACFAEEEAKRLPAAVFECIFPPDRERAAAAAAVAQQ